MTFSIVGRCARTGMFGVAITTSSIAIGSRCPHARAGVGAVSTQNVTDPALGPAVLDLMQGGLDAKQALAGAIRDRPHIEYRQLSVVDGNGQTASFTGANSLGTKAETAGDNCFAAGNLLANEGIASALVDAFAEHQDHHLAERLLLALEAGLAAGGEAGPVHSAALLVVHEQSYPLVDLRVDWDEDDPVGALRRLWTAFEPQMPDYLSRAINPQAAPSYGVPGDE